MKLNLNLYKNNNLKDMLKKQKKNKWSPFHFRQKNFILVDKYLLYEFLVLIYIYIYIPNFICLMLQSLSLTNRKENHQKKG
jgi:hypothetical protein